MHTIETGHNNHITEFPSCMEELSSKEYLYFLSLVVLAENHKLDFTDVSTRMFYALTKIKAIRNSGIRAFDSLADRSIMQLAANVSQLTPLVDFLFLKGTNNGKETYQPTMSVINFLPKYKGFYGPEDAFQNLTVIEYIHSLDLFQAYAKSRDEAVLDELIAVLYRPRKWFWHIRKNLPGFDGQIRQAYNENTSQSRIKKISKWPYHIKYAVYLYFLASDEFLRSGELEVSGSKIDLSVLFKSEPGENSASGDGLGMLGILYKVAETGVFGDIKSAANQNLYDLMLKLYQNHQEYLNYKSKKESNDNNRGS